MMQKSSLTYVFIGMTNLILDTSISKKLNEFKRLDKEGISKIQIKDKDKNIISANAAMVTRKLGMKKGVSQPLGLQPNTKLDIRGNRARRSNKVQNLINEMRSKSPMHILQSEKLVPDPRVEIQPKQRIKSPIFQRVKSPLQENTEISDFPSLTAKEALKLKSKEQRKLRHDHRIAERICNSEKNSTTSECSPFACTNRPRIGCGLQSTFSKKFQSTKGAHKPKMNFFNAESFSPRKARRNQRPKQDLSSFLSDNEITLMRDKIMNDFTSLV